MMHGPINIEVFWYLVSQHKTQLKRGTSPSWSTVQQK